MERLQGSIDTKRILIVEDDPALAKALSDKFAREGLDVLQAKNGEEGILMAIEQHPHILLLDLLMPKMDGIQMLKELRKDQWGHEVPVVMLTNLESDEKAVEALEEGAYDFLLKSETKLEDVVSIVKTRLGMP